MQRKMSANDHRQVYECCHIIPKKTQCCNRCRPSTEFLCLYDVSVFLLQHICINVYLLLRWHFDIFNLLHVYNNIHLEAFSLNNLKQVIPHQRRADVTSDWQVCPDITNRKCLFVNLGHYISPVSCHSINHIFMSSFLSLPTPGVFFSSTS